MELLWVLLYMLVGFVVGLFCVGVLCRMDAEDQPEKFPNGPFLTPGWGIVLFSNLIIWPIGFIVVQILAAASALNKRKKNEVGSFKRLVARLTGLRPTQ